MPFFLRARKDITDPRPIRVRPGPSFYSYYWKLMALFDHNDEGEFVLPFSRRLVHTDRLLWPRSHSQPPPSGYELCGCIGCENKSYADHILKDYDDVDDPDNGNYHIEEVYIDSEDEKDNEENGTPEEDDDDEEIDEMEIAPPSSTASYGTDMKSYNDSGDVDSEFPPTLSDPPSPFACDPYESFDYEC